MFVFSVFRPWLRPRPQFAAFASQTRRINTIALSITIAGAGVFALTPSIHLDAAPEAESIVVDPATGIEFPTTLRIPSRFPLPSYTLLGVGVRTVSFLGIKVYSVAFYADLTSIPPHSPSSALLGLTVRTSKISRSISFEDKIRHVVEHSSCVMRIVPTRSTSYSHLRDGFMRALQGRRILQKGKGLLTAHEEAETVSPLLKFKSIFPNTPLTKHTPLDIISIIPTNTAVATSAGDSSSSERRLIVRDLGSISNDWVAKEFMLTYFEGHGISPPLKHAVEARLLNFGV